MSKITSLYRRLCTFHIIHHEHHHVLHSPSFFVGFLRFLCFNHTHDTWIMFALCLKVQKPYQFKPLTLFSYQTISRLCSPIRVHKAIWWGKRHTMLGISHPSIRFPMPMITVLMYLKQWIDQNFLLWLDFNYLNIWLHSCWENN